MFYDITWTRTIAHDNLIPMFANIVNLLVYVRQACYICIYMSNKSWLMYILFFCEREHDRTTLTVAEVLLVRRIQQKSY